MADIKMDPITNATADVEFGPKQMRNVPQERLVQVIEQYAGKASFQVILTSATGDMRHEVRKAVADASGDITALTRGGVIEF